MNVIEYLYSWKRTNVEPRKAAPRLVLNHCPFLSFYVQVLRIEKENWLKSAKSLDLPAAGDVL